jgi:hypothetical protein
MPITSNVLQQELLKEDTESSFANQASASGILIWHF